MPDSTVRGFRLARAIVWLVYAFLVAAIVILVLAFFLLLFNASTAAEFTQWVYRSADRVLQPFRGIFPTAALGERGSVVDFAILFAIIVYAVFALVVHAIVSWLDDRIIERRRDQLFESATNQAPRSSEASGPG